MPVTTSTAANSIREAYEPGFVKAVFRNDSFLGLFGEWDTAPGDTNFRWKANSSGNDSVAVYTEGDVAVDAGHQTISNCAVAWTYVRGYIQITGHSHDALGSRWVDQEEEEGSLLVEDLIDLMTTSFMGSTYGLELAVSYADTYAGVTRNGSAGWFESSVTGSVGTLAYADLVDLQETVRDNDKGGLRSGMGIWVCPVNQETNVYALAETNKTTNVNTPGRFAENIAKQTVCGYPLVALPDFTNTVMCLLDMSPGIWAKKQIRPFTVHDQGRSADSDVYQVSWGGTLACKQPKFHGKLTGVTA